MTLDLCGFLALDRVWVHVLFVCIFTCESWVLCVCVCKTDTSGQHWTHNSNTYLWRRVPKLWAPIWSPWQCFPGYTTLSLSPRPSPCVSTPQCHHESQMYCQTWTGIRICNIHKRKHTRLLLNQSTNIWLNQNQTKPPHKHKHTRLQLNQSTNILWLNQKQTEPPILDMIISPLRA